jgi:lipooligosaccharide transport system ATP-binding protein
MSRVIVEAKGLRKTYLDHEVVSGLDFEIYRGECFGLLGPNGAGKSSTMKMMYGSTQITSGELFLLGLNVKNHAREIKGRIGIIPQEDGLDPDFSALDNLLVFSSYQFIPKKEAKERALQLLKMLRLEDHINSKVEHLSGGMKRRLTIARGLINNPDLLILDEPTTGLDPQARLFIWEYLRRLKNEGKTLILTTHYMEEAEFLCDRLAVIDKGMLLGLGTAKELVLQQVGHQVVEFAVKPEDINYFANRLKSEGYSYLVLESRIFVYLRDSQNSQDFLKIIASDSIVIRKPGLNDVFLKLAGHQLRD